MYKILNIDYLELLKDIPDNSVDLVLTDPPYGISYQNNYTSKKHNIIENDENDFSYANLAKESYRVLKNNTAIFVFTGWSTYPIHFQELKLSGLSLKEPLICQKRASGKTDLYGSFQSNSDWILFAHKGRFKFKKTQLIKNKRAGTIPNIGRQPVPEYKTRFPSCWFGEEYPWSSENSAFQKANDIYHPTIKGLEFIKWLIQISTNEGDTVVDPFLGSGTTAVACKELNRNFIGSETNKEYYELATKRINNGG